MSSWRWSPRRNRRSSAAPRESIRDLVAAWEQREVMAREVAVDVASHSPQVDPILDDLAEVLADLDADGARPSRTTRRRCTTHVISRSGTPTTGWTTCVTQCGSPQRCRRRWKTGYRVFGELAPHPLLTHAVEQTARSLDIRSRRWPACGASRSCRTGCAAFVADLHSAGAAVDFSVLCPERAAGGRAVADLDAPSAAA